MTQTELVFSESETFLEECQKPTNHSDLIKGIWAAYAARGIPLARDEEPDAANSDPIGRN